MAGKRPPNAEATQFRTGDEQVKTARKGGIASGKKRRENKTIQRILTDYLAGDADSVPALAKLADSIGCKGGSIKEIIVLKMLLNTIKEGDLSDLERLMKLLGEQRETAGAEAKLDALLKEFIDAVREDKVNE